MLMVRGSSPLASTTFRNRFVELEKRHLAGVKFSGLGISRLG
jgi:hypothetical protein